MFIAEISDAVNPLCKLSSIGRSRICILVFSANFASMEQLTPVHNLGCAKNQITFLSEDGQNALSGDQYYEYIMISCYESVPEHSTFSVYYVSHIYEESKASRSNSIFTYVRSSKSTSINLTGAYNDPRIDNIFSKK